MVMAAFKHGRYNLCLNLLQYKELRTCLSSLEMQCDLIKLLRCGQTCAPAINMLSLITTKSWHLELTRNLCDTLSKFAKKTE